MTKWNKWNPTYYSIYIYMRCKNIERETILRAIIIIGKQSHTNKLTHILSTVDTSVWQFCRLFSNITISRYIMLPRLIFQILPRRPEWFLEILNFIQCWRVRQATVHHYSRTIHITLAVSVKIPMEKKCSIRQKKMKNVAKNLYHVFIFVPLLYVHKNTRPCIFCCCVYKEFEIIFVKWHRKQHWWGFFFQNENCSSP